MKKVYLFLALLIVLSIAVNAEQTIYDKVQEIKNNPERYTLIIGKYAGSDEVQSASELVYLLDLRRSNYAEWEQSGDNLIIVGVFGNNQKITEDSSGLLIKVRGTNLIVAGSSLSNLKDAVNIVKEYEKNKAKLTSPELSSLNLFSPIKKLFTNMILIYLIVGLLVIGSSAAVVIHVRNLPVRDIPKDKAYYQLKNYIIANLDKGYTQDQIWDSLVKAGWNEEVISNIFRELSNSYYTTGHR